MKTVGELLSEKRRQKNLSLDEVERATKIRKKILQALEISDWGSLPSPTFVKGLIKNYGKFLGLDQNQLIAFYRREFDEKKITKKGLPGGIKTTHLRLTPQIVTVGVILAISFLVAGYLFIQYESFTGPPLLDISEPMDNVKISSTEVTLVGKTWDDAILKVNGQDVPVSPGGTFSISVELSQGVNTITVTSANRFGRISTAKRTVVVELPSQQQTTQTQKKLNLSVKASPESVNLVVEVDGKTDFEGVLVAGSTKTFQANQEIKIHTKNGGSTIVDRNGQEEVLGKPGEEIEKIYTLTSP